MRNQALRGQQAALPDLRDYRLHERIAQDELATIYAATHLTLERPVEVHILRRTDWVSASRFQLAARLGARLNHPNLLPVRDAGHDDYYGDFLVTPLLEAYRLSDILEHGPLDPMPALRIVSHVAAALDYLHAEGIYHRDVQPVNILITTQETTYLTNLSLAASPDTPDLSSVDEADYLTPYSAPEQHLDQSEASPALDTYALGAVLYHMLSGEIPPAPEMELPTLASHDPGLEAVDQVLQRMMAVEPEQRFASAGECLVMLRRALRPYIDQATADMEESRWEPVAEWLENPLETVLVNVLKNYAQASQPESEEEAAAVPYALEALQGFQDYMSASRSRANILHRADTIRRVLSRWSRKGFFRLPALGQVIQLEQIVSYNIYFYELRTLYETRTPPERRRRVQTEDDRQAELHPPPLWDVVVPEAEPFAEVRPQELILPNTTQVFPCPTCSGAGSIICPTCDGGGTIEPSRKVRDAEGNITYEVIPEQCPTCRGYGRQKCSTCEGMGNLVEEELFRWSRKARLWQNTDDIEGLPRLALQQRASTVCSATIDPYEGYWHSVAPMDELLRAAIADAQDTSTRIIAAELQISGVPITEVDYQYRDQGQRLYLIGQDSEVVGNWTLYNPERIALVAIGIVAVLAMLVFALLVFF